MAEPFATYAALRNQGLLSETGDGHFRVERHFLIALMAKKLDAVKFDEVWYLNKYPDVKDAVRRGTVGSALEHYTLFGYYEHRMPVAIRVNEKWYLEQYPDVVEAIRRGAYKTAQAHFDTYGFREGRMPYANFRL